jgi:hypothetical protein
VLFVRRALCAPFGHYVRDFGSSSVGDNRLVPTPPDLLDDIRVVVVGVATER